jgi:hypothetical protein
MLDKEVEKFVEGINAANLETRIESRLEVIGYPRDFSTAFCGLYMSLRHLRNFYTHRGLDKSEADKLSFIQRYGLFPDSRMARSVEDINRLRKIFYASLLVFRSSSPQLFSLEPLEPLLYTDLKIQAKLYREKDLFFMMRHNLEVLLESDAEHLSTFENDLQFSIQKMVCFFNEVDSFDLDRMLSVECLKEYIAKDLSTIEVSQGIKMAMDYFNSCDDLQRMLLIRYKKSGLYLVKYAWLIKLRKIVKISALRVELKRESERLEKAFVYDRIAYFLY